MTRTNDSTLDLLRLAIDQGSWDWVRKHFADLDDNLKAGGRLPTEWRFATAPSMLRPPVARGEPWPPRPREAVNVRFLYHDGLRCRVAYYGPDRPLQVQQSSPVGWFDIADLTQRLRVLREAQKRFGLQFQFEWP